MAGYLARIYVTLKPTVNDPQGLTIQGALRSLGFAEVEQVRAGKYLEIRLPEPDEGIARERVDAMCRRLLANPVIEDYRFELSPGQPQPSVRML
ncbi:MAG TPA: phosphoribosylformylglycinamidine synthase subunit PurS [Steroidobacteraceae bacterium]|nr:phosphoribosylformylglycinamidine synthase subunit PurS [Steroidobacteraceae bacterium]